MAGQAERLQAEGRDVDAGNLDWAVVGDVLGAVEIEMDELGMENGEWRVGN